MPRNKKSPQYLDFTFLLYGPDFTDVDACRTVKSMLSHGEGPKSANSSNLSHGEALSVARLSHGRKKLSHGEKGRFPAATKEQKEEIILFHFSHKIPLKDLIEPSGLHRSTVYRIVAAHKKSLAEKEAAAKAEQLRILEEAKAKKAEAARLALEKKIAAEEDERDRKRLHFKLKGDTDY